MQFSSGVLKKSLNVYRKVLHKVTANFLILYLDVRIVHC